ncbi:MAG: hypothetical protein AB7H97_17140 [Pseudobdellovibrionaceae bacterium]
MTRTLGIPDFITHYSRGEPFRSLSDVPNGELDRVLQELNEANAWGLPRFSDPEYLPRRVRVEQRLRAEFIDKGGIPTLEHPIYFFLGRNPQFEEHERNKSYSVRLKDIPKNAISFTYGDSMFSLDEDYRKLKGEGYLSELCPHVYTIEELPALFAHHDLLADTGLHIEAQVWIIPSGKNQK